MKALSVCQPWAFLLVNGLKDVENRTFATSYRGPLLIHASASAAASRFWRGSPHADASMLETIYQRLRARGLPVPAIPELLDTGGIVGRVELLDCITAAAPTLPFLEHAGLESPWFFGPVGWLVADAAVLPFRACKGRLKVFDCPQ